MEHDDLDRGNCARHDPRRVAPRRSCNSINPRTRDGTVSISRSLISLPSHFFIVFNYKFAKKGEEQAKRDFASNYIVYNKRNSKLSYFSSIMFNVVERRLVKFKVTRET